MNVRGAVLLLRVYPRRGAARTRAVRTVVRAAEAGDPAAVRAFAQATGSPLSETMWRTWLDVSLQRWASPLLDVLSPPPDMLVNAAWTDWLDEHDDRLWSLLDGWGRAAAPDAAPRVASLSRLARGDDDADLAPDVLAEAAARFDHPIGDRARARLAAHPEPDAVETLCAVAVESPDLTAFCVAHHLAPSDPVERAAFFVRTGQHEQHRALDGDGTLLAMAYRTAAPDVRARLRTIMAAEGDSDLIRVVVAGERRDRVAEMSDAELDYLGHHLAECRRWPELRGLVRDLPLAKAAAAARLLPEDERTGDDADLLALLTARPWQELRATVGRLPAEHLTTFGTPRNSMAASISPDSAELAVSWPEDRSTPTTLHVETVRIGAGESTLHFTGRTDSGFLHPLLHLGDEILLSRRTDLRWHLDRVFPERHTFDSPEGMSPHLRRTSRGAVMIHLEGLAFADPGADRLRLVPVHSFRKMMAGRAVSLENRCQLTTLPAARLIAFSDLRNEIFVTTEDGADVRKIPADEFAGDCSIDALSFLGPNTLAVHGHARDGLTISQHTEIWELPPDGAPHRTGAHDGPVRDRWPVEEWEGSSLDPFFAHQVLTANLVTPHFGGVHPGIPWLQATREKFRRFLAMPLAGDMLVTSSGEMQHETLEIHSRHLPTARAFLERPFLHCTPQDLQRTRELRLKIADPAVRDALDLLGNCLAHRFGGDIALGTGPAPAAGPTDIALSRQQGGDA
ncbi:hypothetical protein E1287_23440 [Actinomadura sp. KC06]|uniref:hypothetical protein n=1 Tax=Actinomadura sp. KC06 TaxID=2530369 RepID=UPI00104CBBF4|nr:hypothetical protein [Actinomadura sp. KC06]TDD32261.1 hypothetical protein E1287_23440 [Actinomadura sp. KC06]